MADAIRDQIKELLPAVAESISLPSEGGWDVLGLEQGGSPSSLSARSTDAWG